MSILDADECSVAHKFIRRLLLSVAIVTYTSFRRLNAECFHNILEIHKYNM